MPVSAPPTPPRTRKAPRTAPTVPLVALPAAAAAAGAAWVTAPGAAREWAAALVAACWLCVAVTVTVGSHQVRRARRAEAEGRAENSTLRARLAHENAACLHLVNVALPGIARQVRDGVPADEAVANAAPVPGPHLPQVVRSFATLLEAAVRDATALEARQQQTRQETRQITAELEHLTGSTLPAAVAQLRDGTSADHVLDGLDLPHHPQLRACAERFVRELAHSERRTAAAQAAAAKSLSRVQAKAVSMLADLREMQDRHGEEVLGDLMRLDHSTSQLGLVTDRLAILMGGRSSRAWNKPIVMESILRGAVGRIAAYRRVRMHCASTAAISGYAAEGVMHLLAELMDNAANFSPPIDEVHVYVEERTAGIVVTIEDSGLKMADAAMHHAEEAVSGRMTDLAQLQGTRLGLAVVGRLAAKYRIGVSYRPSSRGGTGVVVLLPPHLLAQQREPVPAGAVGRPTRAVPAHLPAAEPPPPFRPVPEARPVTRPDLEVGPVTRPDPTERPAGPARPAAATPGGLPVRSPGRTMAEAERERLRQYAAESARHGDRPRAHDGTPQVPVPRDAGTQFGAFHRGRRSGAAGTEPHDAAAPHDGTTPPDRPTATAEPTPSADGAARPGAATHPGGTPPGGTPPGGTTTPGPDTPGRTARHAAPPKPESPRPSSL
ncbi:ATP-binding protein [Streptomyces sp. NPDC006367]|uniref:ATP-binding protein n=1 Tax=unclassified Streptomyces TaxID=2593676 RepID=UPI0033BCEC79